MVSTLRIHIAVALTLLLIATGLSLAMARASTGPAGQIVLCAGSGPVVIFLDENGDPTGPPHVCPDFAMHIISDAMLPVPAVLPGVLRPQAPRPAERRVAVSLLILSSNARAPPVSA